MQNLLHCGSGKVGGFIGKHKQLINPQYICLAVCMHACVCLSIRLYLLKSLSAFVSVVFSLKNAIKFVVIPLFICQ